MFRFHADSDKPVQEWAEQYRSGMSLAEIAKPTVCSISTVRLHLLAAGVALRTHHEAAVLVAPQSSARQKGRKKPHTPEWNKHIAEANRGRPAAGIRFTSHGYIEYTRGPNKGRSVHVVAMEERLGRKLERHEVVHHIDGDRFNNDLSNLRLMTRAAHTSLHRRERI